MIERGNRAILHNLRTITLIVTINILHVTAKVKMVEKENLFYILLWTPMEISTFQQLKPEQYSFTEPNCQFQNCFITNNASYLNDVANFDAVLFDSVALNEQPDIPLPKRHSKNQRYVLVSTKSSADHPITSEYNNFFNWTWTYKLDSDVTFANIAIRDKAGTKIGPKKEMHWLSNAKMEPTNIDTLSKLAHKRVAGIWLVTNCDTQSQSQIYINNLQKELRKYNHSIDLYGNCNNGNYALCTTDMYDKKLDDCETLVESKYYFYLSFENALSEDFVSTQLLTALNQFAVPVVYGGANHTRFMPDGIYLDALEMGPVRLAKAMNDIISDRNSYEDMFRWHSHYSYHDPRGTPDTNSICAFCAALNDKQRQDEPKVYKNIVKWFNERKDWNAVPVTSKPKRSAETNEKDKSPPNKPKPYVAINIKYPPRPTSRPSTYDDDSCSGVLTCLRGTIKNVWNLLSITW